MSDPIIKIENMNKWFGDFQVLKNIDLSVEKNKKIVVCGVLRVFSDKDMANKIHRCCFHAGSKH